MVDAHFDEVGMLVSEILPDGFLRAANLGGLDAKSHAGGRCNHIRQKTGFRRRRLHATASLKSAADRGKAPKIGELLIDTGYDQKTLETLIRVGSPVGYAPRFTKLSGNCVCSKGLDNKASCAAALFFGCSFRSVALL